MNATTNRLIVTGGSDAQPLSADTIALLSPNRVTRQMRGGGYVTTVVDQDAQIGGDIPTRFLLSESEELVASDGHHITLHPGAISGVTTSGRMVDGLMLSGKKVREEYPSHWLNSAQWLRVRGEAMERGEVAFEGVRRLRVRCGSTAVHNDRPIFFQRRGFGGGAFFAREPFLEAQLADDYLLLDDGIPVERYTAEFYKKRPFIGVRPERIRPGEVFDLTITVCDPESFDNLLITRDDGLRTPEIRVKVNDLDITPALAEKFAGFNPFGFPSNATSPYPGFRLVCPQMKIDQEMPLKIAVEVRDALGNVNQVVSKYSITSQPSILPASFFDFPLGVYHVHNTKNPERDAERINDVVNALGFNIVHGNFDWSECPQIYEWLTKAKSLPSNKRPLTLLEFLHIGDTACPRCNWLSNLRNCNESGIREKVDFIYFPDEPRPTKTVCCDENPCHPEQLPRGDCFQWDPWPLEYYQWGDSRQVFFQSYWERSPSGSTVDVGYRVRNLSSAMRSQWLKPVTMVRMASGEALPAEQRARRKSTWGLFMPFTDLFAVDRYPVKYQGTIDEIALMMDEMLEARAGRPGPALCLVLDAYRGRDEPDPRCPTAEEYVAMTYLGLTHKASGLLYFEYDGLAPDTGCPGLREAAARTNSEILQLATYIHSPAASESLQIAEFEPAQPAAPRQAVGLANRIEAAIRGYINVGQADLASLVRSCLSSLSSRLSSLMSQTVERAGVEIHGRTKQDVLQQAGCYTYRIHALGRAKPDDPAASIHPRRYGLYDYLLTVNGTDSPTLAFFICQWVPGYHAYIPATEALAYIVEVLFEGRTLPLMCVREPKPPYRPLFCFFADSFVKYERHIYKIPGAVLTAPVRVSASDYGLERLWTRA